MLSELENKDINLVNHVKKIISFVKKQLDSKIPITRKTAKEFQTRLEEIDLDGC